jgi:hypothetical protein
MAHDIDKLAVSDTADLYYTSAWLTQVEAHLPYLRTNPRTKVIDVPPDVADRHSTNPTGLLDELGHPRYMHHVIIRLNGWNNPVSMDLPLRVLIPDPADIEKIRTKLSNTYNRVIV